jgi:uncharacterized membrane protein HdeD (DUF308 family)
MDGEGLGAKFWWKLVGGLLLAAVALFVILAVFSRLAIAFGAFGAFLVLAGTAILASWIKERRDKRSNVEVDYKPPPKLRG